MTFRRFRTIALAGLCIVAPLASGAAEKDKAPPPTVKIPDAGVSEIFTMEGRFVRAAYNNEGYVIVGYRLANTSVGGPWMLLQVGMTVRNKVPNYVLTRDAISIETPDGKTIPLATQKEFQSADLMGLQTEAGAINDSINYFPPDATRACAMTFYTNISSGVMGYDQVELSPDRACLGRLYFPVAGGIQYGQHWLNVKFAKSVVRVPFRILTKDEYKILDKNYKDIEAQVKAAFAPKN